MDLKAIKKLYSNVKFNARYGAAGARNFELAKDRGWTEEEIKDKFGTKDITIVEKDIANQWIKQDGRCYHSGIQMDFANIYISHSPLSPSVDRLDNSKGYHIDNFVICLRFFNLGRGQSSEKMFNESWEHICKCLGIGYKPHTLEKFINKNTEF